MVEKREADSPRQCHRGRAPKWKRRSCRAVGEFVLAFSDAEAWTHACIALLCDEPRVRKMARGRLGLRGDAALFWSASLKSA